LGTVVLYGSELIILGKTFLTSGMNYNMSMGGHEKLIYSLLVFALQTDLEK